MSEASAYLIVRFRVEPCCTYSIAFGRPTATVIKPVFYSTSSMPVLGSYIVTTYLVGM
jgi:hypothetical protein